MTDLARIILPWSPAIQATWTVTQVRAALLEHEQGTFAASAKLWTAMGRDDRLSATVQMRIDGLLGAPCTVVADEDDDATAQRIAEEIGADWPTIAPREQLASLLDWRFGVGVGLARLVEKRTASRWTYNLDVWDPQWLSYSDATRVWTVSTQDGQVDIEPGVDGWVLWCQGPRGWNQGMVRSLSTPWLIRQFALRDWASWSERHGMPIVLAKVPAVAPAPDKSAFFDEIAVLSSETTVALPQGVGPNGESYDLDLLEATSTGWEGFERLITSCNVAFAVRALGQNLTTEIQGGSFAASQTANDVRTDLKRSDAEALYAIARAQILPSTVEANYGKGAPVPGPSYDVEPPEDAKVGAEGARTVGEAVTALRTAGVPVDANAFAEKYGVPLMSEADQRKAEAEQQKADEATAAKTDAEPAMAKMHDCCHDHGETVSLASGDSPAAAPGFVAAQLWTDALADDGIARTAAAFRPDLAAIKAIIDGAESFDEVRTKLMRLYREALPPTAMARLLERAIVLGDLAGRWSVTEDL
jgi:phage gp29-like protein